MSPTRYWTALPRINRETSHSRSPTGAKPPRWSKNDGARLHRHIPHFLPLPGLAGPFTVGESSAGGCEIVGTSRWPGAHSCPISNPSLDLHRSKPTPISNHEDGRRARRLMAGSPRLFPQRLSRTQTSVPRSTPASACVVRVESFLFQGGPKSGSPYPWTLVRRPGGRVRRWRSCRWMLRHLSMLAGGATDHPLSAS